ncbi:MAG: S41 family peptidase [bacterium]
MKKKTNSMTKLLNIVGVFVVLSCVFATGYLVGSNWGTGSIDSPIFRLIGSSTNKDVTTLDFDLFWQVWSDLKEGYVEGDISEEDLFYGAIKGLVESVGDPVTVFLSPEETQDYLESNEGKFEGIGAELGYDDGNIIVISPLSGSPAEEAGLLSRDVILAVDDTEITDQNIYEVVSMIRGDEGTTVVLTIGRDNETLDVEITRGEITVTSVELDSVEDGVAIIDLDRFTESSASAWMTRWDEVVQQVVDSEADTVVLDMRGNPGGYFNAAIWAAGDFLEEGTLVAKQVDRNGNENEFTVEREGNLLDVKLVVLLDEGSASSSEILAGALQYHDRAYIIGENTFGKGTAQEVINYNDGSSLHITTLNWVLPDGRVLSKAEVIEPDKEVEYNSDDFVEGRDPQLDAVYEYLGIDR